MLIELFLWGGIINILDWHGSYETFNFADFEAIKNSSPEQIRYFDLRPKLKNINTNIYLFYAGNANSDKAILESIETIISRNKIVTFNTDKHGSYCLPFDYKYLLTFNNKKISRIIEKCDKQISPRKFSIKLEGIFRYCLNDLARVFRRIKRKRTYI